MSKKLFKGVVAGVSLAFGFGAVLALSKDQAAVRSSALEDMGKGRFKVLTPVIFKRGEKIGIEGPVDRATEIALGLAGAAKKGQAAADKAAADKVAADKAAADKAAADKVADDKVAADKAAGK